MIEYRRILCPVDFSAHSDHALRYATRLARWFGAEVRVLHVTPPALLQAEQPLEDAGRWLTDRNLAATIARCREPGVTMTTEVVESRDASGVIIERAESGDVDLVVTGSHGRTGVQRLLHGSVVGPLLHRCRRPVLVIPAGIDLKRLRGPVSLARILCAVDFSPASLAAVAHAVSLAEEADARLTLLNVIDVPPEFAVPLEPPDFSRDRARLQAEAERLLRLRELIPEGASEHCTIATAVREGGVSSRVLRLAEAQDDDLLVIGVHGRNALDVAVFGSNAADLVAHAHCPVLVVPSGRTTGVPRAAAQEEMSCQPQP